MYCKFVMFSCIDIHTCCNTIRVFCIFSLLGTNEILNAMCEVSYLRDRVDITAILKEEYILLQNEDDKGNDYVTSKVRKDVEETPVNPENIKDSSS